MTVNFIVVIYVVLVLPTLTCIRNSLLLIRLLSSVLNFDVSGSLNREPFTWALGLRLGVPVKIRSRRRGCYIASVPSPGERGRVRG